MAELSGEDKVALLLGALPADTAEAVLARLPPVRADLVRVRMQALKGSPPDVLRRAARELLEMARGAAAQAAQPAAPVVGQASSLPALEEAGWKARPTVGLEDSTHPTRSSDTPTPPEPAPPPEPAKPAASGEGLAQFSAEALAAALKGERASTAALVAAHLDVPRASAVLKLLPAEVRQEATLRLGQPSALRPELAGRILQAVEARCRELASRPQAPSADAVLGRFAEVVRALGRDDRRDVLAKLEQTDPAAAEKVRKKLYTFADVRRVDDRTMQGMLGGFDTRTVALALKGAEEDLKAKLLANVSRRAKETILEELELLSSATPAQVEEAQGQFVAALQKLDEEGKITL